MSTEPSPQDNGEVPVSEAVAPPVVDPALPVAQVSAASEGMEAPELTPPPGWTDISGVALAPTTAPGWAPKTAPLAPPSSAAGSASPGTGAGQPAPASPAAQKRAPQSVRAVPRTGPIVWGALILAFCGYAAQRAFGGGELDTAAWITATVIGLGVLLLGVGTAVIIRNRRNARRPSV